MARLSVLGALSLFPRWLTILEDCYIINMLSALLTLRLFLAYFAVKKSAKFFYHRFFSKLLP